MNLALHAVGELQRAVAQSEQGVVLAAANVFTCMDVGAMLTNDNITRLYSLTCEHLNAESLCVRVAAVTSRAKTFLMCHGIPPLLTDRFNLNTSKRLAMATKLLVVLALLELEDENLLATELLNNGSNNLGLSCLSGISLNLVAIDDADSGQFDLGANLSIELLDVQLVTCGNAILLAASFDDSVHSFSLNKRKAITCKRDRSTLGFPGLHSLRVCIALIPSLPPFGCNLMYYSENSAIDKHFWVFF